MVCFCVSICRKCTDFPSYVVCVCCDVLMGCVRQMDQVGKLWSSIAKYGVFGKARRIGADLHVFRKGTETRTIRRRFEVALWLTYGGLFYQTS